MYCLSSGVIRAGMFRDRQGNISAYMFLHPVVFGGWEEGSEVGREGGREGQGGGQVYPLGNALRGCYGFS